MNDYSQNVLITMESQDAECSVCGLITWASLAAFNALGLRVETVLTLVSFDLFQST